MSTDRLFNTLSGQNANLGCPTDVWILGSWILLQSMQTRNLTVGDLAHFSPFFTGISTVAADMPDQRYEYISGLHTRTAVIDR